MNQLTPSLAALKAPQHILAAIELLQFQSPSADRLNSLTHTERRRFLDWCDNRQLTLMLSHICCSGLPTWVTEPTLQKKARYELRFRRVKRDLFEIVEAFEDANLEFVMLKGLSHAPALTPDPQLRAQGDIDLWLIGSSVRRAQQVLKNLGYVPLLDSKSRHLPPMGRPSSWRWRGDLFDPEMPISVELHYDLWSEQAECIALPELEQFWNRKIIRDFDGHNINVLCDADLLGFASLHLFLHLLHGELPLQRAWEVARFLDTHVSDEFFWTSWRSSHTAALRQVETCIFHLVTEWCGCHVRQDLGAEVDELPPMVKSWLARFSLAPLTREWAPNKSEIWLHLAFIPRRKDKARVLFRRLLPTSIPRFADRATSQTLSIPKLVRFVRQLRLVVTRLARHIATFFPTVFDGLRWYWLRNS